jgi:hypothetical protein
MLNRPKLRGVTIATSGGGLWLQKRRRVCWVQIRWIPQNSPFSDRKFVFRECWRGGEGVGGFRHYRRPTPGSLSGRNDLGPGARGGSDPLEHFAFARRTRATTTISGTALSDCAELRLPFRQTESL